LKQRTPALTPAFQQSTEDIHALARSELQQEEVVRNFIENERRLMEQQLGEAKDQLLKVGEKHAKWKKEKRKLKTKMNALKNELTAVRGFDLPQPELVQAV
jgi:chromosome segregation ATPase